MPGNDTVQSVDRAARILDAVSRAPDGLTLQQVSTQLGLKPTTAHNLIRTLAQQGLLERLANPARFRLGPALFAMAARSQNSSWRQHAAQAMHELVREFPDAVVLLAEMSGGEVIATLRLSPDRPGILQEPQRQIMAPYSSASALAWQAFGPPEVVAAYRQHYPFDDYATRVWSDPADLELLLVRSRQQGWLQAPRRADISLGAAAPVYADRGALRAVLALRITRPSLEDLNPLRAQVGQRLLQAVASLTASTPS